MIIASREKRLARRRHSGEMSTSAEPVDVDAISHSDGVDFPMSQMPKQQVSDQGSDQESERSDDDTVIDTQGGDGHSVRGSSSSQEEELMETVDPADVCVIRRLGSQTLLQPIQPLPDELIDPENVGRSLSTCGQTISLEEWNREAAAIPIPELLRWIARQTHFTLGSTQSDTKKPRLALSSSSLLPSLAEPEPFLGLSTSPGIVSGFEEHAQAFNVHRQLPFKQLIGKYAPPKDMFSFNIQTFKPCDKVICADAMRFPTEVPNFLVEVKGNFQSVVRDADLQKFEEHSRKSLLLLSHLDATVTALLSSYPLQESPSQEFMRGLFRTATTLSALADLASASLHQAVTHRRDTAISPKLKSASATCALSDEHLAALRGGSILDKQYLFSPDLLKTVQQERDALRSEALQTAALTRLAYPSPQTKQSSGKRPAASASQSSSGAKKQKSAKKLVEHSTPKAPQSPSGGAQPQQTPR